ncbi:rCG20082 [Rattus norvegicus]|uniref:RCG20082 n=1 Tax=Rattus norvegicus TaxID=10116 RepID=A6JGV4_RAT|nr:rCG20082 [Rattus norvegicus]
MSGTRVSLKLSAVDGVELCYTRKQQNAQLKLKPPGERERLPPGQRPALLGLEMESLIL